MADRVYPIDVTNARPISPETETPVPSPGTYVIQLPKDQVYRFPSPENERRYQQYTRRKHRRGRCCCCFCWMIGLLAFLFIFSGTSAAVFYLVLRPESPDYSIDAIAIKGINLSLTAPATSISPELDLTFRALNPNKKIGIYYEKNSLVEVHYSEIKLCDGVLLEFYQPSKNVTIFMLPLSGSHIELTRTVEKELYDSQKKNMVPLKLDLRAPVKLKVGSVRTWTITVTFACNVTVDKLTANAKIVSKKCGGVKLW